MRRDIQSLRQRILVMSMLPSILISILLGATYLFIRFAELDSQFLSHAKHYTQQQASTAAFLDGQNNYSALNILMNMMLDDRTIQSVSLYDSSGQQLLHAGSKHTDLAPLATLLSATQTDYQTRDLLQVVSPAFLNSKDEPVTWLMIEFSLDQNLIIKYQSIVLSILLVILSLTIALTLSVKLGHAVTLPLKNLTKTLASIRDGHFDVRLPEHPKSLMHNLEATINDVINNLQNKFREMTRHVQQYNDELQETLETIEVQNVELDIARKKALDTSRMKSEFLANMSHEIRTPLNGVLGFSNLMLDSRLSPQQHDYMTTIEKSSQGMLSLLNNILDFSRIEAGKLTLEPLPMNLRVLTEDVLAMFAPEAHDKNLELVSFIYNDVPEHIIADHQRLKQVLTNLISNAVKFTHDGSIAVRVMLDQENDDGQIIIKVAVTDSGIGIMADQQPTLFDAFIQASNNRRSGGSGLGLAISKRLTEEMGGGIGLESELNQGSTFWFTFRTCPSDLHYQSDDNAVLTGKKIALIIPEELSRLSIAHLLGKLGGEVQIIEHPDQLIHTVIDSGEFDLALISTQNIDTTKLLHDATNHTRQYPIILLTRADCNDLSNQPLPDQISTLLQPISQTRLEAILLNSHRQHQQPRQSGLRILAVDDNPVNLKLLETIMGHLDLHVCSARNGFDAIDLSHQLPFDLIFMDVQMPGMDGMEATLRIRKAGSLNEQTPVIAVTAHALPEERQKLLDTGINDYMTKPVSEAMLITMINRWAISRNKETLNALSTSSISVQTEVTSAVVQPTTDNTELIREMQLLLQKELPSELASLKQCWHNQDYEGLLESVHRLHGASHYCDVPELQQACAQLENSLKQKGSSQDILSGYYRLIKAINRLQQQPEDAIATSD